VGRRRVLPGGLRLRRPGDGTDAGQPWTATTWSLDTLRGWGLDPTVLRERDTVGRLAASCRWEYDDLPYWGGEVDCCINGMTLANGVWLGADVGGIADWFVEHATAEGGWNCEWVEGSTRSSVRSTLNALQGLLELEESGGGSEATRAARLDGEEYLLRRGLFRRLTTGEPIADGIDSYAYPFRSHYSVLRATDYFRRAAALGGHGRDPRLAEAVELVRAARRPDGTWLQQERYPGRVWFHVDVPPGEPSPWLTFYGTRVLDWWDAAA